jgi:hypothetical protein
MLIYLSFLVLTIALELLVARLSLMFDNGGQYMRDVLPVVLGINLITHPFAWGSFVLIMANWMVIELLVVLVEALALWSLAGRNLRSAAGLSAVMNGVSMATGLVLAVCSP